MIAVKKALPCNEYQLLLILQSDQAHWIKIVNRSVVEYFVEVVGQSEGSGQRLCDWLESDRTNEPQRVQLILDTTLDEVDRILVPQSSSSIVNRYRTFRTMRRLAQDYNDSYAHVLPSGYGEQVAVLMHPEIPEPWNDWLLDVQSNGFVFDKASTGTEVVARWARSIPERVLFVMGVADRQRHILLDTGVVVYLRNVLTKSDFASETGSASSDTADSIDQSLRYLDGIENMRTHELTVQSLSAGTDLLFGGVLHGDQANDVKNVECLLAMVLSLPIEGTDVRSGQIKQIDTVEPMLSKKSVWRLLSATRDKRYEDQSQCLLKSVAGLLPSLAPSVKHFVARQRIAVIACLSIFFASGSTVFAFKTLAQAYSQIGQTHGIELERSRRQLELREALAASLDLSKTPRLSADSLLLADELIAAAGVSSEAVLLKVAAATTAVPDVRLDRLIWIQAEKDESFEYLDHAMNALAQSGREYTQTQASGIQLQLTGYLDINDLSEQKRILDSFVKHLNRMQGVSSVRVLISPLDAALSSQTDLYSGQFFSVMVSLDSHS